MLDKEKIISLLNSDGTDLFEQANETRQKYVGDDVHLRGLIEFSNTCKQNCFYCGLRCENKNINRYRLTETEILDYAKSGKELGLQTIVLQSGEDTFYTQDKLCKIIESLKKLDVAVTLSLGEKTYKEYQAYKSAGADRYLLRIETTDEELYKTLHPNMSLDNRKECLYILKELGFETGTGSLVGLPNQTIESLAEDILFYKKLDADMIGVGPFIPHPDTPLGEYNIYQEANFWLSLRVMAISRILLKDVNIPATTAMETIHPDGRKIALQSGANVVMPNIVNGETKENYSIYPNKNIDNIETIKSLIYSLGRGISTDKGFRNR